MTETPKPYAAATTDYLGCEYISLDIEGIEKIAAAGSQGPTDVVYLYAGSPPPPPHVMGSQPVQDQWFTDRNLPIMALSGDVESDRVLKLHFRRPVSDDDRKGLVEALNLYQKSLSAAPLLEGWQLIKTCPRNQSVILQCWWKETTKPYLFEGYLDWDGVTWHEQNGGHLRADITDPVCWQPMPAPALSAPEAEG